MIRLSTIKQLSTINTRLVDISTRTGEAYLVATPELAYADWDYFIEIATVITELLLEHKLHPREVLFKDDEIYITTHDDIKAQIIVTDKITTTSREESHNFIDNPLSGEQLRIAASIAKSLINQLYPVRFPKQEQTND